MSTKKQLKRKIKMLKARIADRQAVIDALMIEFVPEEMTQEQWGEYAKHQRPAENVVLVATTVDGK